MRKLLSFFLFFCLAVLNYPACAMERRRLDFSDVPKNCWVVIGLFLNPLDLQKVCCVRSELSSLKEKLMIVFFGDRWREIRWERLWLSGGIDGVCALNFFYSAIGCDFERRTVFEIEQARCEALVRDAEGEDDEGLQRKLKALMAYGCFVEQLFLAYLFVQNRSKKDDPTSIKWQEKLRIQIETIATIGFHLAEVLDDLVTKNFVEQPDLILDLSFYKQLFLNAIVSSCPGSIGYCMLMGLNAYVDRHETKSFNDLLVVIGLVDDEVLMRLLFGDLAIDGVSFVDYFNSGSDRAIDDISDLLASASDQEFRPGFGTFSRLSGGSDWQEKKENQQYLLKNFRFVFELLLERRSYCCRKKRCSVM